MEYFTDSCIAKLPPDSRIETEVIRDCRALELDCKRTFESDIVALMSQIQLKTNAFGALCSTPGI